MVSPSGQVLFRVAALVRVHNLGVLVIAKSAHWPVIKAEVYLVQVIINVIIIVLLLTKTAASLTEICIKALLLLNILIFVNVLLHLVLSENIVVLIRVHAIEICGGVHDVRSGGIETTTAVSSQSNVVSSVSGILAVVAA